MKIETLNQASKINYKARTFLKKRKFIAQKMKFSIKYFFS